MFLAPMLTLLAQGRLLDRDDLVARGGGSAQTESAVLAGLRWLARHQNEDGSWDEDVEATGAALTTFLGAGYTHLSTESFDDISFGGVVERGLAYLIANQHEDGRIGDGSLAEHTAAAHALTLAYGYTGARRFKAPAQFAIDLLVARREKLEGLMAVAAAVEALKDADLSGIDFDRTECYEALLAALDASSRDEPVETAMSAAARILMTKQKRQRSLETVAVNPPGYSAAYAYWGSIALFKGDGPDGARWEAWNRAMVDEILKRQDRDAGSEFYGAWEEDGLGRVRGTALRVRTLGVYYRYGSILDRR